MQNSPLNFKATGGQFFILYLKTLAIIGVPIILMIIFISTGKPAMVALGFLVYFAALVSVGPIAANWNNSLLVDNTSVDGKQLRYHASFFEMLKLMFVGSLLTIVTLGIYSFWYQAKFMRFIYEHSSYDSGAAAGGAPVMNNPSAPTTNPMPQSPTMPPAQAASSDAISPQTVTPSS